jgi:hypothetical protein
MYKRSFLPRQALDKHREKPDKTQRERETVSVSTGGRDPLHAVARGKKTALFEPFIFKNGSFYQDWLGTNAGKVEKRVAFFAG